MKRSKALVTGGSSGIGLEFAKILAKNKHDLVLVARDKTELGAVKTQLETEYGVLVDVIATDLSEPNSAKKLFDKVSDKNIEILINNAGFGHLGNLIDDDLSVNQRMAHLNMVTVMDLMHYFGAAFKHRGSGKILNVGSIASFIPGPKQPVYYATKAFVRSMSRAVAEDLKGTGVTVTVLHPGATKTKFWDTAGASFYKSGVSASSVAETGYAAMMRGKVEVVHGFWNKIFVLTAKLTPVKLQTLILNKFSSI